MECLSGTSSAKAAGRERTIGDLNDLSTIRSEWIRLPPEPKRYRGTLPRRSVAERTFSWLEATMQKVKKTTSCRWG